MKKPVISNCAFIALALCLPAPGVYSQSVAPSPDRVAAYLNRVQETERFEGQLVPFTQPTKYMSLPGFLRWQDFLDVHPWAPKAPKLPAETTFALAYSPDGKSLAGRTGEGVEVWDVQSGKLRDYLPAPGGWFGGVAYSYDGRLLISAGARTNPFTWDARQGEIRIWEAASGKLLSVLWAHPARAISAVPTPDGKKLISSGQETTLRTWKLLPTGAILETELPPRSTSSRSNHYEVRISPNGRFLGVGDTRGGDTVSAAFLNLESGQPLKLLLARGPFAFSPDSTIVATGGVLEPVNSPDRKSPQLWELATSKLITRLTGHPMTLSDMTFSPDGRHLIGVGWQYSKQGSVTVGELAVWDLETRTLKYVRRSHDKQLYAVAVSPDGKQIATGGQYDPLRLWELETGHLLKTLSSVR